MSEICCGIYETHIRDDYRSLGEKRGLFSYRSLLYVNMLRYIRDAHSRRRVSRNAKCVSLQDRLVSLLSYISHLLPVRIVSRCIWETRIRDDVYQKCQMCCIWRQTYRCLFIRVILCTSEGFRGTFDYLYEQRPISLSSNEAHLVFFDTRHLECAFLKCTAKLFW